MERIWLSPPHMGTQEYVGVTDVFNTNWLAPVGSYITNFEAQIAAFTNTASCAALSSGTAAIHLALIALGVQSGDWVICQSFTFAASAFPILHCGAQPIFIDSESTTWNMDANLLRKALHDCKLKGKLPKAIIVVHLYGMPAQMDEILAIANEFEVPIIEDAAEALGSSYLHQPCGSIGKMGIFSFNGNKIITTSGGGALVSNDKSLIEHATYLATQAKANLPYYQHHHIGYNYRLSNVLAAIGCGQMQVLNERILQRRWVYQQYTDLLSDEAIRFLKEPPGSFSNRWLTTIVFSKANEEQIEKIRIQLDTLQIETRLLWKPLHLQPVFSGCKAYVNGVSETLYQSGLCLPSGSSLTEEKINHIVYAFKNALAAVC